MTFCASGGYTGDFCCHPMRLSHGKVLITLWMDRHTDLMPSVQQQLQPMNQQTARTVPFLPEVLMPSSPVPCASILESHQHTDLGLLHRSVSSEQRPNYPCLVDNWSPVTTRTQEQPLLRTSGFDAGVRWGGLLPVPTGVFHVRPVRGKVLQIAISTNDSKFPVDRSECSPLGKR